MKRITTTPARAAEQLAGAIDQALLFADAEDAALIARALLRRLSEYAPAAPAPAAPAPAPAPAPAAPAPAPAPGVPLEQTSGPAYVGLLDLLDMFDPDAADAALAVVVDMDGEAARTAATILRAFAIACFTRHACQLRLL